MADLPGFGSMDLDDRGGPHVFVYEDRRSVPATAGLTPSQTVGPFFAYGLTPGTYGYLHAEIHRSELAGGVQPDGPHAGGGYVPGAGTHLMVEGQVFDGAGVPIHDAMVEIIQADADGHHARARRNDGFTGYGRYGTGPEGPNGDTRFRFRTVKPGATGPGRAPSITFIITMRGLLNHCITRMYFPGDDHTADPVFNQVPPERRSTLVATEIGPGRFRFDIHMQGEKETVFFDL